MAKTPKSKRTKPKPESIKPTESKAAETEPPKAKVATYSGNCGLCGYGYLATEKKCFHCGNALPSAVVAEEEKQVAQQQAAVATKPVAAEVVPHTTARLVDVAKAKSRASSKQPPGVKIVIPAPPKNRTVTKHTGAGGKLLAFFQSLLIKTAWIGGLTLVITIIAKLLFAWNDSEAEQARQRLASSRIQNSQPEQTYNPPTQQYQPQYRPPPSDTDRRQYSRMEVAAYNAAQNYVKHHIPNPSTARFGPISESGIAQTVTPNLWSVALQVDYINDYGMWQSDPESVYLYYYPDSGVWQALSPEELLRIQGR